MAFRFAHSGLRQRNSKSSRRSRALEQLEHRWAMDGSLAISEIMYAPLPSTPGATDGGEFEFIELQNVGDATLNLDPYQFTAGIVFDFPAVDVAPGQFVVVPKNPVAFQQRYGNVPGLINQGYPLDQLSNGGEELILQGPTGVVAQFTYDNKWYPLTDGGGFSLVAVTPGATTPDPNQKAHWRTSLSTNGSPGVQDGGLSPGAVLINEILTHTDIDTVGDWIELKNTTSAPIDIGGWFLSDKPSEPMRFRIPAGTIIPAGGFVTFSQYNGLLNPADFWKADPTNPNSVPFQFLETGETVVLTQADTQGNFLGYRVEQAFGAADREFPFGRYVKSSGGTDFTTMQKNGTRGAENTGPLIGPIVINELFYSPANPLDEFIELRNITSQPVQLFHPTEQESTWKFTAGVDFTFPQGQTIPAGGFALVVPILPSDYRLAHPEIPLNVQIYGPYTGALSNSGEEVLLAKPGDKQNNPDDPDFGKVPYYTVERVNYSTSAPWPDGTNAGASLARVNATGYPNDGANWAPGVLGGTPGAVNSTTILISAENTTVEETDSGTVQALVTVRLGSPSSQVVTVQYTTQSDEAISPGDFVAQSGTLTFQPNETEKIVTVVVNGDTIDEPGEKFFVVLSNPTNVTLGDFTGEIEITDNDPPPTLGIPDVSAVEGDGGIPFATLTLTLSAVSEKQITVAYSTANGTATEPADYAASSGTVTFAPNTASQTLTIALVGDDIQEGNENFVVNFSTPNNVGLPDTQAVVTILDDDAPTPPWQNQAQPGRWDVNADGTIAALDVLILINRINATGGGTLDPPSGTFSPPPYYDVDGNGSLEPLDVLNVINFINAQPASQLVAFGLLEASLPIEDAASGIVVDDLEFPALPDRPSKQATAATLACNVSLVDDALPPRVADEVDTALVELLD
jgi:hypothetical protein